jgi:hypothetical protein
MANTIGFDPVPIAINGGRHRASALRTIAYTGTSGAEGIVSAGDLKVAQVGGGTNQVSVATGAVLLRNRSSGVKNQSYALSAPLQSLLDVAPNSSGSMRYDLVIARVKDPEYAGFTLPGGSDPLIYQYATPEIVQNVPAGTKDWGAYVTSLGTPYSAYILARLEIPNGTSNITTSMIKDVRKVAQPLRETKVETYFPTALAGDPHVQPTTNGVRGQYTPMSQNFDIPSWATQAKVVVWAGQLRYNGTMTGRMRADFAGVANTQDSGLQNDSGSSRTTVVMAGEMSIPSAARGTTKALTLNSTRISGAGVLGADEHSTIVMQVTFVEVAE